MKVLIDYVPSQTDPRLTWLDEGEYEVLRAFDKDRTILITQNGQITIISNFYIKGEING